MADITADSTALVPEPPSPALEVAPSLPDDLMHVIFNAVREELELEESDESGSDAEILAELRTIDKAVVSNAQGKAIITFEVGKEWPALAGSKIIAMFGDPIEGAMPGDLRVYVAPAAPLAGARDYLCMTFNRMSLGQVKEVMTRELFVAGVGGEFAALLDPGDEEDDEGEDEEEEGLACSYEGEGKLLGGAVTASGCAADPTLVCVCQACKDLGDDAFATCGEHQAAVAQDHLKQAKRPPKWEKIPEEAEDN